MYRLQNLVVVMIILLLCCYHKFEMTETIFLLPPIFVAEKTMP